MTLYIAPHALRIEGKFSKCVGMVVTNGNFPIATSHELGDVAGQPNFRIAVSALRAAETKYIQHAGVLDKSVLISFRRFFSYTTYIVSIETVKIRCVHDVTFLHV